VTYITILKSLDPRHVTGLADICDQMSPGGLTVTSTIITCTCLPAFPRAYIAVLMGANETPLQMAPSNDCRPIQWLIERTELNSCYVIRYAPLRRCDITFRAPGVKATTRDYNVRNTTIVCLSHS